MQDNQDLKLWKEIRTLIDIYSRGLCRKKINTFLMNKNTWEIQVEVFLYEENKNFLTRIHKASKGFKEKLCWQFVVFHLFVMWSYSINLKIPMAFTIHNRNSTYSQSKWAAYQKCDLFLSVCYFCWNFLATKIFPGINKKELLRLIYCSTQYSNFKSIFLIWYE